MASEAGEAEVGRYPTVAMTPPEYERAVGRLFACLKSEVGNLTVRHQELVRTPDGDYKIDTVVRYELFGVEYVTLVEAKLHRRSIERRFVQELAQKVQSTGAHKGILVASSPFQRGALEFARAHGIGLVQFVDGRLTVEVRARVERSLPVGPAPWFAGYSLSATDEGYRTTAVSMRPEYARSLFPGFDNDGSPLNGNVSNPAGQGSGHRDPRLRHVPSGHIRHR